MLRYLSETTEEERLHVKRGTIDLLDGHMKMRFVAPGDWIRIKFDLQPLVRQACGEAYLCSRLQAGELLQMVYTFGPWGHWVTHRSSAFFTNFSCTWVEDVL